MKSSELRDKTNFSPREGEVGEEKHRIHGQPKTVCTRALDAPFFDLKLNVERMRGYV